MTGSTCRCGRKLNISKLHISKNISKGHIRASWRRIYIGVLLSALENMLSRDRNNFRLSCIYIRVLYVIIDVRSIPATKLHEQKTTFSQERSCVRFVFENNCFAEHAQFNTTESNSDFKKSITSALIIKIQVKPTPKEQTQPTNKTTHLIQLALTLMNTIYTGWFTKVRQ